MIRGHRVLLAAGLAAFCACRDWRAPRHDEAVSRIRVRVQQGGSESLRAFYAGRGFAPAWTDLHLRQSLVTAVDDATREGLDPRAYQSDRLHALVGSEKEAVTTDVAAERDVAFSSALLEYADDLAHGRAAKKPGADAEIVATAQRIAASGRIAEGLRALVPQLAPYRELRDALKRYRAIADGGGWPSVPAIDASVDVIGKRIASEGDPDLRAFQARHGLEATGKLNRKTLDELNVSAADRVKQIAINLERWRRLPYDLGARYVWVSITGFRLDAFDHGSRALEMRVIVGTQYDPTPMFWDNMAYVIFNPYWNIPEKIAREEILPKGKAFMRREGIEVEANGKLRQKPGPKNPLGRVKFILPNKFDVYLHDTPSGHAFSRDNRDLSHGCIRVEKPIDLAEFVLAPSGQWNRQAISAAIESGETKRVDLPGPLPVYVLYWTAWVDDQHAVQFRDDMYGYDAALGNLLSRES